MEKEQGEGLKHLSENLDMGSCYRTYEEGHDGCMRCAAKLMCKDATIAAKEAYNSVYANDPIDVLSCFLKEMGHCFTLHETKNGENSDLYRFAFSSVACNIIHKHDGGYRISVHGEELPPIEDLKINEVEKLVKKLLTIAQSVLGDDENK